MTEEQYRQLCCCCDELLTAPDSLITRVAIPWLHVLNEHPANLECYAAVFNPSDEKFSVKLNRKTRNILAVLPRLLGKDGWYGSSMLPHRADVVIFSHLLNRSQVGETEDFYFGHLPQVLAAKGLTTVVALRDHTRSDVHHLPKRWSSDCAPRVFPSRSLGWVGEIRLQMLLRQEARRLKNLSQNDASKVQKHIREHAALQALSGTSVAALRFYFQVRSLMQRLSPSSVVVTYEGHAWERLVFAAARSVDPSIRCVGYQHAILFPRQHAIKRSLSAEYEPDVICTAGEVTRNILLRLLRPSVLPVITVGTHRQEDPPSSPDVALSSRDRLACLVIPDGTIQECLTILDFTFDAAEHLPDIDFVVRMHPVMSIAQLKLRSKRFTQLPRNVYLSNKSITDDFVRCRWAIYRGSGAAIRSVVAGLRPFYFKPPGEQLTIDPLSDLPVWKRVISSVDELLMQIQQDLDSPAEKLAAELEAAREYCKSYFTAVDTEKFCGAIVRPD